MNDYEIATAYSDGSEKWKSVTTSPAAFLSEVYATPEYISDFVLAFQYAQAAAPVATQCKATKRRQPRLAWIIDEVP